MSYEEIRNKFHEVFGILVLQTLAVRLKELKEEEKITLNVKVFKAASGVIMKSKKELIEGFTKYTYPIWHKIKEKDRLFFTKNSVELFSNIPILPTRSIKKVTDIFEKKDPDTDEYLITDDEIDEYHRLLEQMVRLSIKYVHLHRLPEKIDDKIVYTNSDFMHKIDIETLKKEWNVDLD